MKFRYCQPLFIFLKKASFKNIVCLPVIWLVLVLVGRLHKPSFLFAYLMGHLIRVNDGKLIGNYISEAKGPNIKLTIKTVQSLAVKIDKTLDNNYPPPPPKNKTLYNGAYAK